MRDIVLILVYLAGSISSNQSCDKDVVRKVRIVEDIARELWKVNKDIGRQTLQKQKQKNKEENCTIMK